MTEDGKRHRVTYRGENLYIFISDKTLDMSMMDMSKDLKNETDPTTLVGLGIISKLTSLCLAEGIDPEIIASDIWSESRKVDDLADIISKKLIGLE